MNKPIYKALIGSQNYNLQLQSSDKDYKVFVYPSFEDLYKGKKTSLAIPTKDGEESIYDIRKLPYLLYKTNINFTESLFSDTKTIYDEMFEEILAMRESLAKMNLPYLYDACFFMSLSRKSRMMKPTIYTQDTYDKYGYDVKAAYHALRLIDFLERYSKASYKSFRNAFRYNKGESIYSTLMMIRTGRMALNEFERVYEKKLEKVILLKPEYTVFSPNEALKKTLEDIIFEMVKNQLLDKERGA